VRPLSLCSLAQEYILKAQHAALASWPKLPFSDAIDLGTTDPTRLAIHPPQGSIDRLVRFVLTGSRLFLTFEVSRLGEKWNRYDWMGKMALWATEPKIKKLAKSIKLRIDLRLPLVDGGDDRGFRGAIA
jgi:hypothetical protein